MVHYIKRGLELPISGQPEQRIDQAPPIDTVALIGDDYIGMKPTMLVSEGDKVLAGQPVFECKKTQGVLYSAPFAGEVTAVNRGEKRKFLSLAIRREGEGHVEYPIYDDLTKVTRQLLMEKLIKSGLWTALRSRPFSKVADPATQPHSIFVTAIDTHPLAADPQVVISKYEAFFNFGLHVLDVIGDHAVHVCTAPEFSSSTKLPAVKFHEFSGPHPAGLAGTHIHMIDPVGPNKSVWYINYQDVIAIGHLFQTGKLWQNRIISLAGPRVKSPRLIECPLGANLDQLTAGQLIGDNNRIISGSVFGGRERTNDLCYLGRYHNQVTVLEEGTEREFLGWQGPGADKFSLARVYLGSLLTGKKFDMTTSTGGSKRAMVPIGTFEKVMPLDILPTQLLRALIVNDTETAQALGALELDEEDLALCTYACPGKYEYGSILRENLTRIEKEG